MFSLAMMKWSTTLILILAFSASTVAGMPTHPAGDNPAMMSCCKAAKGDNGPQASLARVCCAIHCPEPTATTGTASSISSQSATAAIHPPAILPATGLFHRLLRLKSTPFLSSSQPKYIRNLALLI